ncbi:hypothetical protein L1987_30502 [Smallanthus sonchifolius]|uniref:Uncharacterized protein n=1 Tax=Smallanthus sonchifolius TaxID=185202 RepID=A0ACB9I4S4_9ASTR|nr:hypothetical protein L1987_30502 [Smallanthus sonchifolius]
MNATSPHFIFKAFNPNISIDKLKIPSKFVKHLEGKTNGTIYLMGPSGNTWHADLVQETDGLFILNGWGTFVRDHFLENEDSLWLRESINGQCEVADFLSNADICSGALKNPMNAVLTVSAVRPNDDELGRLSAAEADKIAQSFTSSFPHFTQVMKRFNISGSYTMNVPYQFAMAHLPKCKVKIVLHNLKGEYWTVNSIPTTRVQTSHTLCG